MRNSLLRLSICGIVWLATSCTNNETASHKSLSTGFAEEKSAATDSISHQRQLQFWNKRLIADGKYVGKTDRLDYDFKRYASFLRSIPKTTAERGISQLVILSSSCSEVQQRIIVLSEWYFFSQSSKLYAPELYDAAIQAQAHAKKYMQLHKIAPTPKHKSAKDTLYQSKNSSSTVVYGGKRPQSFILTGK